MRNAPWWIYKDEDGVWVIRERWLRVCECFPSGAEAIATFAAGGRSDNRHNHDPVNWCRDPWCTHTNWGGYDRLHMRGSQCPPYRVGGES